MRRSLLLLAMTLISSCQVSEPAHVAVELPVMSRALFRGELQTDETVLEPHVHAKFHHGDSTTEVGLLGVIDLTDGSDSAYETSEVVPNLDYTFPLGELTASVGAVYYSFPNFPREDTSEVYAVLGGATPWFSTSISAWVDVDDIDGTYVSLSAGRRFDLGNTLALDLGTSLGWADDSMADLLYHAKSGGFGDLQGYASLGWHVNPSTTLSFVVLGSTLVGSDARDGSKHDDHLLVAFGPSFSF